MHVIDNSHNEIRGSRVERDAGRDEKQLIKFAWPKLSTKWISREMISSMLLSMLAQVF